jgi:hypothetical protein
MDGLYLDPPERALVPCVDEKSQIQAWTALCYRYAEGKSSGGLGPSTGVTFALPVMPAIG